MPIKLWIDGKVRELLRSAGGDGGGRGDSVYPGEWVNGLAVRADAMSCPRSCSERGFVSAGGVPDDLGGLRRCE